eukprot:CAMPEP_0118664916 /NCGR_PEP_ID=MMETSP0785-20121206/18313_1 /TAXON_ID=91992 /ORGANISM="Bolidomonas pacifica, Strain CCMP 1866" /LENGTH=213 /DNA_ID=CAMNT_0006558945 /DNA_START=264 /DNA_END=902 /DNA_ORIENTATION=+
MYKYLLLLFAITPTNLHPDVYNQLPFNWLYSSCSDEYYGRDGDENLNECTWDWSGWSSSSSSSSSSPTVHHSPIRSLSLSFLSYPFMLTPLPPILQITLYRTAVALLLLHITQRLNKPRRGSPRTAHQTFLKISNDALPFMWLCNTSTNTLESILLYFYLRNNRTLTSPNTVRTQQTHLYTSAIQGSLITISCILRPGTSLAWYLVPFLTRFS